MKDKLLLIDGHSILSRAFYGIPLLTNSQGIHTNAVYGFLNIMFKVMDEEKADHLAVAFDVSKKTFRTELFPAYKGTRKPMPEELLAQVPLIQEVLSAMNIPILKLEGYEADDILGTIAKRSQAEGIAVTVLSGDRDLLQLADEEIKISVPKTSKGRTEVFHYYPEDVKAQYGVTPLEFIDMKALMGDASDNIPGVPSIGEKTAGAIIGSYHSIENAYAHIGELKPPRAQKALSEHYELAKLSKVLATIRLDVPVSFRFPDAKVSGLYNEKAFSLIKQLEFKTIAARFPVQSRSGLSASEPARAKRVSDPFMAQIILKDAASSEQLSFLYLQEEREEAREEQLSLFLETKTETAYDAVLALCLSEDRSYLICSSEEYPAEELRKDASSMLQKACAAKAKIGCFRLKEALKHLSLGRSRAIRDLSIGAYLLNPLKDSYDYEDVARDLLSLTLSGREELIGKKPVLSALFARSGTKKKKETEAPEELKAAAELLLSNAVYTAYAALLPMEQALLEAGMLSLYEEVEMPLCYSLSDMEKEGVCVDRGVLKEYAAFLQAQIEKLEEEIYAETGERFNLNSPSQLGVILFEKMGIKGAKKTKTGYSTAADVLNKLAPEYPFVEKILRYRALTKLHSTYAVGLDAYIGADGRIHGTFNQTVTATGRISSTDPNLQNIPVRTEEGKEIRKVFIPAPGYVFVDADYSQVELRILAALSRDKKLIEAYRDVVDVHTLTASEVFRVPLSEVTAEMRRNAKAVNFGIVYGISAFGLGENLSIGRKEAQEYINKYFETYPDVKKYLDAQVTLAKEQGYVTTYFGRVRPIPEISSSNFMTRSFGERVAMNSPIQGTAADIMKIAMNRVNLALSGTDADGNRLREPMKSHIVLQIHDELLVETAPEEEDTVKEILVREMEAAAELSVRLSVEAKSGGSWYECH